MRRRQQLGFCAIPKCATEADLVRAMRQAIAAFPEADSRTLGTLRAASSDPRRRMQTSPTGVYCITSPQRLQVWKAITAAFQGHAAEIAIDEVERQAFDELVEKVTEDLDPRKGLWSTIWRTFKPVAIPVGSGAGVLLALRRTR